MRRFQVDCTSDEQLIRVASLDPTLEAKNDRHVHCLVPSQRIVGRGDGAVDAARGGLGPAGLDLSHLLDLSAGMWESLCFAPGVV